MNRLLLLSFILLISGCGEVSKKEVVPISDGKEFVISILTETRTTQYFSEATLSLDDINVILEAGRNSFSGRNMQPWHFSAIINRETIESLAANTTMGPPPGDMTQPGSSGVPLLPSSSSNYPKAGLADAPAAIVISCVNGDEFSAGLACESMVVAARAIGYGVKIIAGAAGALNTEVNRELLSVPEDMDVVAILMIGNQDSTLDMTADGVTGASTRKSLEEISTIVR